VARIFLALSLFTLALLGANIVAGFMTGDFNGAAAAHRSAYKKRDQLRRQPGATAAEISQQEEKLRQAGARLEQLSGYKVFHFLLGLLATLVTVLVNSITVTYFIGTNRWCREVIDAYHLDASITQRSDALKRAAFPWAALGIVSILVVATLGAASDPSANTSESASYVNIHMLAALTAFAIIGYALFVQMSKIAANYAIIEEILAQVHSIREAKRLSTGDGSAGDKNGPGEATAQA